MGDLDQRDSVVELLTRPDGPFPVGRTQVRDVDLRVFTAAPDSLRDVLLTGRRWGDRSALTYEDEHWTWTEYLQAVGRFAGVLVETYGIRKGDRVALAARNYAEWVMAFAATASVGAVCVPLNGWWTAGELANALADCSAAVVVADAERSAAIQSERHRLPALRRVVEVRPTGAPTGDDTWDDLLAAHPEEFDLARVPIEPDDDVTIMYTSGTTGRPKGAVATHRAHLTTLLNMQLHARVEAELAAARGTPLAPPSVPTTLIVGPLFHVASLPRVISAAATGTHLVLMRKWDARRAVELIDREGVDTIPGAVPTVVAGLLDEVERSGAQVPSLRSLTSGGAQTTSALVARTGTTFDHRVASGTGYGLTETTGAMMLIGARDFWVRPMSVGRAFPTTEMRVVGQDGTDVPVDGVGEAWLRGASTAYRYWNQESDAFDADGWFHSGDLVRVDDEGFVYVVDRIKDVVIRSGENVYCSEVEDVLSSHPDVLESAVVGRPHEVFGEEVVAFVRPRPGAAPVEADLRQHVAGRLAPFKVPVEIHVQTADFPRNAVGKVLKQELRRQVTSGGVGQSAESNGALWTSN
jgi:acyl-CoA synthetase (AMP-forming)/AMP-acid ligase II